MFHNQVLVTKNLQLAHHLQNTLLYMRTILIISVFALLPLLSKAQYVGVGASGIYNFQTESIGAGARVSIYPARRLSIVPQFSYYFGFNKITELTMGLGVEYKVIRTNRLNYYIIGHGGYNQWLNAEASVLPGASPSNWNAEGGIGISTTAWIRPFIEYRYNLKFQETHLQLGILYIFGRSKNPSACPAF